jgi:hypothetical protein
MSEEKAKILLRLYKEDLITADEFLILCKDEPIYIPSPNPNWVPTQPLINTPYYTTGTGAINTSGLNSTNNFKPNVSTHLQSTVGGTFSKKWINPEEPKFEN